MRDKETLVDFMRRMALVRGIEPPERGAGYERHLAVRDCIAHAIWAMHGTVLGHQGTFVKDSAYRPIKMDGSGYDPIDVIIVAGGDVNQSVLSQLCEPGSHMTFWLRIPGADVIRVPAMDPEARGDARLNVWYPYGLVNRTVHVGDLSVNTDVTALRFEMSDGIHWLERRDVETRHMFEPVASLNLTRLYALMMDMLTIDAKGSTVALPLAQRVLNVAGLLDQYVHTSSGSLVCEEFSTLDEQVAGELLGADPYLARQSVLTDDAEPERVTLFVRPESWCDWFGRDQRDGYRCNVRFALDII